MEAEIDPKVAALLDKHADKAIGRPKGDEDELLDGADEDALLEELEQDDSIIDAFREKRMQQLHDEYGFALQHKQTFPLLYTCPEKIYTI